MKETRAIVIFFVVIIFALLTVPEKPLEVVIVEKKINQSELTPKTEELQKVKVGYEIEYGTIYTGDQTPLVHKGTVTISAKEDMGIGSNGLPVLGFFPTHSDLIFTLYNGEEAILHIPVLSLKQVKGLLEVRGFYHVFMDVEVSQKGDDCIFVYALPAADQGKI